MKHIVSKFEFHRRLSSIPHLTMSQHLVQAVACVEQVTSQYLTNGIEWHMKTAQELDEISKTALSICSNVDKTPIPPTDVKQAWVLFFIRE